MEDTTEMLSMSRPLPSTVIVGVPARKYIRDINFSDGKRGSVDGPNWFLLIMG